MSIKNSGDNSEMIISQYPKDSVWINSTQKICKYNDNDSLIYKEKLEYKLDSLVPRKRYFYGFSGGRKTSELEQIFYVKWRDQYRSGLDTNWGYANKEIITDVEIDFGRNHKSIARIGYALNKDADLRIYIANNVDREIKAVHEGKQTKDKYNFEFDASDFLGGQYYIVFETSGIKGEIKLPTK